MPAHKKHSQNHGLGKALMNHRAKTKQSEHERELHTTHVYDNKPISVTQESDLENFLNTATMAGKDFTALRQNVVIINSGHGSSSGIGGGSHRNPFLLSPEDQAKLQATHQSHHHLLRVPRRPKWSQSTTPAQLDRLERDGFLDWRKGLADLTDNRSLLLTPFERNIEVWKQLWRVIERSQLIVQIVDARNPLRFRCEDLERYVEELSQDELFNLRSRSDPNSIEPDRKLKTNLLLVNKSDLLTQKQRSQWAEYFDSQGIQYAFFSATEAVAHQTSQPSDELDLEDGQEVWEDEEDHASQSSSTDNQPAPLSTQVPTLELEEIDTDPSPDKPSSLPEIINSTSKESASRPKTKILTVSELEDLFLDHAKTYLIEPTSSGTSCEPSNAQSSQKLVVGLVGYPNVGKSSTINALVGSKKVSVSATPGKTKHFQTIHLSNDVILCDCPGLVFPQFASTKAELVCDGVLPIDQMREHTGPISLVTQRIPKPILEATYGLQLQTRPIEEGGDGQVTASELLTSYAIARGAFTGGGGMGRPDESKVARPILKDYVSAKLLYCHPPPLSDLDSDEFNAETREMRLKNLKVKKLAPITRVPQDSDTFIKGDNSESIKKDLIDRKFLEERKKAEDGRRRMDLGNSIPTGDKIKLGIKGRRRILGSGGDGGQVLETIGDLSKLRLTSDGRFESIDNYGNPIRISSSSKAYSNLSSSISTSSNLKSTSLSLLDHHQPNLNSKKHFKRSINPNPKKQNGKKIRSGKGYDDF